MDLFARPALRDKRIAEIKHCVVQSLGLDDAATVLVTELQCREDGCPPLETVIAVFSSAGPKLQFKLHQPLDEVTDQDVVRLCVESRCINNETKGTGNAESK
jgi:hypothetical protein